MSRFARNLILPLALSVALSACAEVVRIRSYPAGGAAFLDDEFIGTTPIQHVVPRSGVRSGRKWRVEHGNCTPAQGTLATRVGGGRVVGYIFTLGFTALFKGPRAFVPVEAQLTGGDCAPAETITTVPQGAGVVVTQIVGDANATANKSADESAHRELASRLMTLRDLYRRKLITEGEYETERSRALREFESRE